MDIFDQILENLELERELGTRTVEIDRALLVPPPAEPPPDMAPQPAAPPKPVERPAPSVPPPRHVAPQQGKSCDIMFLTGRALSAAGEEAIRKTIDSMKKIKADINVCIDEKCSSKVIILLGSVALKKHAQNAVRASVGDWIELNGVPTMITFSPDYIFSHFMEGSAGMVEAKRKMWNDVKAAIARL